MGADGQVTGGVVMGVGSRALGGDELDDEGRQLNPHLLDYKLITCSDAPEIEVDWVEIPTEGAGPRGTKGVGEPPQVPTAAAIANAIAKVVGTPRPTAADDARAGLGRVAGGRAMTTIVRVRGHDGGCA